MRELSLIEIQNEQIRILKIVTAFCNSNNIDYSLCAGTMLGAIRHKGFIPWDDDIDLMMPRPDYERFIKEFKSDKVKLYCFETTLNYNKPFAKVGNPNIRAKGRGIQNDFELGLNIDIFPLDGLPKETFAINSHIKKLYYFRKLLTMRHHNLSDIFKHHKLVKAIGIAIITWLSNLIPVNFLVKKIIIISKSFDFQKSAVAGITVWGYGIKEVCPKDVFTNFSKYLFEGTEYSGVQQFDVYLSTVYGDYMKLPPEDKRTPHPIKYYG